MDSQLPESAPRTMTKTSRTGGVSAVALGFVTYLLGRTFDSGFVGGLFDGATIALMVMGAYLIGASTWRRSEHWLPSQDENSGGHGR